MPKAKSAEKKMGTNMSKSNNAYRKYMERSTKKKGGVGVGEFEWLARRVTELEKETGYGQVPKVKDKRPWAERRRPLTYPEQMQKRKEARELQQKIEDDNFERGIITAQKTEENLLESEAKRYLNQIKGNKRGDRMTGIRYSVGKQHKDGSLYIPRRIIDSVDKKPVKAVRERKRAPGKAARKWNKKR